MKSHKTKEERFEIFMNGVNQDRITLRDAFYAGWYAAGSEINEGEDSDWLSESLHSEDFIEP